MRTENICSHKNVYRDANSTITHKSQKMEMTQMSIIWWMEKHDVSYDGIWFDNSKEKSTDMCFNTDQTWKQYAKAHSKRAMWGHSGVTQRGLLGETKSAGTLISNSSFQKYEKVNFETKQEHYTKWKKLVIKSHILCDSIYINVQTRQIHGDRK